MTAKLRIPTPLRTYTEGCAEIEVTGSTVGDAVNELIERYPVLKKHLINEAGSLRPFVNLYLNEEDIRQLDGVKTPLKTGDLLRIIPSIAGGSA